MRRCTLRGRENILKRLLIHVGAFNLSLILQKMLSAGTPRELEDRAVKLVFCLFEWFTFGYRRDGAVESAPLRFAPFPADASPANHNIGSSEIRLV